MSSDRVAKRVYGRAGSRILVALLGVLLAILVAAPAQAQLPSICQQYPNLPQCLPGGGGGGDDDGGDPGAGIGVGAGDGDGTGDLGGSGRLPFTGYPVTSLILLALLILLAGLVLRTTQAINHRLRERYARAAYTTAD
jgi:hypothetical protein